MKHRRFIKKRRQRAERRLADLMSAKRLCREDRQEVLAFRDWLRTGAGDLRVQGVLLSERLNQY